MAFSSVAVLRQYAFLEDHVAVGHGQDSVAAQFRAGLEDAIQHQCLVPLGGFIQTNMLHTGDLIDDALRLGLLACIDGLGSSAGCTPGVTPSTSLRHCVTSVGFTPGNPTLPA